MIGQTDSQIVALDPRSIYKLSKARKSGSATNISVTTASSIESALCSSPEQVSAITRTNTVVTSPGGDCRSRRDSRHKLRAHLFGTSPESVRRDLSDEESEGRHGLVEAARGVRDRLSRTSTIVSQRSGALRSKPQRNHPQSQLLVLSEPTEQEIEDSDHVANQIRERAYLDQMAALNHVASPVDEDMHVDSVASPIRRRSLFTPGIATRTPNDILCKPPSAERKLATTTQESYFNLTSSDSSPLSRLASLDLIDQHRSLPGPRTSTPSNLDYTELGGLKFGTLRITNGVESPKQRNQSPLTIPRKPLPIACPSGDYFTTSKGKNSDDENALSPLSEDTHQHNKQSIESMNTACQPNEQIGQSGRDGRPVGNMYMKMQQSGSPLKYKNEETEISSADESIQRDPKELCFKTNQLHLSVPHPILSQPSRTVTEDHVTEFSKSAFDTTPDLVSESNPIYQSSKKGRKLFRDKSSKPASPQSPNRNWNAFIDDAERRHSEVQFHQFEIVPMDGSNASSHATDSEPESLSSSNTSIQAEQLQECEEKGNRLQLPTEAVSGYSSNSSLVSLAIPPPPKNLGNQTLSSQSALKSQYHSKPYSSLQDIRLGISEQESTLSLPIKKLTRTRPSSWITQTSATESLCLDSPTQRSSDKTILTRSSMSSTLASSKSRKLKKERPLSQPSPMKLATVQASRDLCESYIPPVPADIAARHAERLHNFPLLEHTFPSLHHTELRDSTPSPDLVRVPIRFPSPSHATDDEHTSASLSLEGSLERTRDIATDRPTYRRSRTSFIVSKYQRRSSRDRVANERNVTTTIADFGTVTESLGDSPYDVARSTRFSETPISSNDSLSHPHQMTVRTPRAKSMIGMDELEAIELSRLRSQHKNRGSSRLGSALHNKFEDGFGRQLRPVSLDTDIPPIPALPTSVSPKTFNDRGGVPGKLSRPRSMAMDVPPLPALPSPQQVERREAEISRSASEKSHVLRPPHNTKVSATELSKNRTPEVTEQVRKPVVDVAQGWESYSQAWSQRRKSAGDGLLQRNQATKGSDVAKDYLSRLESLDIQPKVTRPRSFVAQHPSQNLSVPSRPFHVPVAPPPSVPIPHDGYSVPSQSFNPLQRQIQRISGRFEGGLAFGYEPGFGIGGSAGTRSMKTGASRKSVDVSLGYGIDLSDVPIFVAPS